MFREEKGSTHLYKGLQILLLELVPHTIRQLLVNTFQTLEKSEGPAKARQQIRMKNQVEIDLSFALLKHTK
jgi:hypothetical protein